MPIVKLDGVEIHHDLSDSKLAVALQHIQNAREVARKMLKDLRAAIKSGEAKPYVLAFLSSPDVLLACAVEANRGMPRERRSSLERCLTIPGLLNVKMPIPESVRVYGKKKSSGGIRAICVFDLVHRTAQTAVKKVVEAHFKPRGYQLTFRGIHEPISVAKGILSSGLVHYATLDITNHFGSFCFEELAALLPLREEWVEHVVLGRHIAAKGATDLDSSPYNSLLTLVRQGMSTGSICSPIIAAYSVRNLKWKTGAAYWMTNYSDNFLVLALGEQALDAKIRELTEAVAALPGGHFKLRVISRGVATTGIEFLGHSLRITGDVVSIDPAPSNFGTITGILGRYDAQFQKALMYGNHSRMVAVVQEQCAAIKGWGAAFRACQSIDEYVDTLESAIRSSAVSSGIDFDKIFTNVKAAKTFQSPAYFSGGHPQWSDE